MPISPPPRRIIVLGASGFIGSHLIQSFSKTFPHSKVRGFSSSQMNLLKSSSVSRLTKLIDDGTLIVHCASRMKRDGDSPELLAQNVMMTMNVLKACKKRPPAAFIYLSSQAVFGEERQHVSLTEKSSFKPTSFYGLSKKISESLIIGELTPATQTLIIRPPFVYGPGDSTPYSPSGFLYAALRKQKIVLWGDGSERREFLYIHDLTSVVLNLLKQGAHGPFNITGGARTTFRAILSEISSLLKKPIQVATQPRSKQKVDFMFGDGRLRATLPKQRYTTLKNGLKRTFQEYKRAGRSS